MIQEFSYFQKKHKSTFLDNKKLQMGYPNRVADLSAILHTQLLLHRTVYPLLWLYFYLSIQNMYILYVSWLISKFTSTFSFGSDWGAGTLTGQPAVRKVAYYSQEGRVKRDLSQNFQKQEKKALKLQNKTFCTRTWEREREKNRLILSLWLFRCFCWFHIYCWRHLCWKTLQRIKPKLSNRSLYWKSLFLAKRLYFELIKKKGNTEFYHILAGQETNSRKRSLTCSDWLKVFSQMHKQARC